MLAYSKSIYMENAFTIPQMKSNRKKFIYGGICNSGEGPVAQLGRAPGF